MNELDNYKNNMSKSLFGISYSEALEQGICVNCKEEALPKCYSDAGVREYQMSGLCEECYDTISKEED